MEFFDRLMVKYFWKFGTRLFNVLIVVLLVFNGILALLAYKVHSYLLVVAYLFDGGTEIHGTTGPAILLYLTALANIFVLAMHLMARIFRTDCY
ncbi:hypothetical protein [Sinomicrobium oceani]|uniref:hypothetical protein n=1 Tax=Sinomicrobium oceani TaxID=1150368 RepID=UPI00227A2EE2|nr:hypothetical protein [Sinomicrobium oceani]